MKQVKARVERSSDEELLRAQRRLELAHARLQRVKRDLTRALEVEDAAEVALADRVHALNLEGVEGRNAAEREAAIYAATTPERERLAGARQGSRRARGVVERAQETYDVARYRHRTWRILAAKAAGVGGEDAW